MLRGYILESNYKAFDKKLKESQLPLNRELVVLAKFL